MKTRAPLFAVMASAVITLTACSEATQSSQVERLESGVLYRNDGPELNTIDPHLSEGAWNYAVIGDLFVGLLRRGPDGNPEGALAQSWTVSEDGLVWTFSMREAQWSDGRAITADDVVYSLRRAVNPATAAAFVEVYSPVVNAEAILAGEADPETLGVTALDPLTVEIRLVHPMPFLPQLLADSRGAVVPGHVIEAHGIEWTLPENIVVNGAYTVTERTLGRQTVLARNPLFYDNANVCFDEVFSFPISLGDTAARQARAGELDIAASIPPTIQDRVAADLPGYMRFAQPPATFFFLTNTETEPFNDVRVREALGISLDRTFAFEDVIPHGLIVAERLVPTSLTEPYGSARITWADEPIEGRRARALALLTEAGFGPDNPLIFEFAYPSSSNGDRFAPVLQSDWNTLADWVQVEIFNADASVHYQSLGAGEFQAALGGWVASIRDTSYMMDVVRDGAVGNFSGWSNPEVERLAIAAQSEQDPAERARLFREAEQIALDDFAITPFYHLERAWTVHPRITGWIGGSVEYTPAMHLCLSEAG